VVGRAILKLGISTGQAASQLPSPLRTGCESFLSPRSSPSNTFIPTAARSRLAPFSEACIMNTGGKGALREGRIAQMTAALALHWVIPVLCLAIIRSALKSYKEAM
jgi:hypothetical protein